MIIVYLLCFIVYSIQYNKPTYQTTLSLHASCTLFAGKWPIGRIVPIRCIHFEVDGDAYFFLLLYPDARCVVTTNGKATSACANAICDHSPSLRDASVNSEFSWATWKKQRKTGPPSPTPFTTCRKRVFKLASGVLGSPHTLHKRFFSGDAQCRMVSN